eukprot:SAG11_NODE_2927_length_2832_cov_2.358946_1_plen_84_part_00
MRPQSKRLTSLFELVRLMAKLCARTELLMPLGQKMVAAAHQKYVAASAVVLPGCLGSMEYFYGQPLAGAAHREPTNCGANGVR